MTNVKSAKTNKNIKKSAKNIEPKIADTSDPKTTLNTVKTIPTNVKLVDPKKTDNDVIYHVVSVQFDDGTTIHKLFRVNKIPTYAVLVKYAFPEKIGALAPHHVLTYSRSEKLCQSHVRRIKKQYVGKNATITERYTPEIQIVRCRDLGIATSTELDPNLTENRSWERAKNAAAKIALAAKNPTTITTAALALNTAVLENYINQ